MWGGVEARRGAGEEMVAGGIPRLAALARDDSKKAKPEMQIPTFAVASSRGRRRKSVDEEKAHVMMPQGLKPHALRALYVGAEAPTP
jgi:hypothetical protein